MVVIPTDCGDESGDCEVNGLLNFSAGNPAANSGTPQASAAWLMCEGSILSEPLVCSATYKNRLNHLECLFISQAPLCLSFLV